MFGKRQRRDREEDSDLERGTLAVIILMGLVLLAIGIGTVAGLLDKGSLF